MAKTADADTSYRPPTTGLGGYPFCFHSVPTAYTQRMFGDAFRRVEHRANHAYDATYASKEDADHEYLRWHTARCRMHGYALAVLNGERKDFNNG